MQNLYPNFYSLTTNNSENVDVRRRRRSLIWSGKFENGLYLTNAPSVILTQPLRRRCSSLVTSGLCPNADLNGLTNGTVYSECSSGSPSPTPPPPAFADTIPRSASPQNRKFSVGNNSSQHSIIGKISPCEKNDEQFRDSTATISQVASNLIQEKITNNCHSKKLHCINESGRQNANLPCAYIHTPRPNRHGLQPVHSHQCISQPQPLKSSSTPNFKPVVAFGQTIPFEFRDDTVRLPDNFAHTQPYHDIIYRQVNVNGYMTNQLIPIDKVVCTLPPTPRYAHKLSVIGQPEVQRRKRPESRRRTMCGIRVNEQGLPPYSSQNECTATVLSRTHFTTKCQNRNEVHIFPSEAIYDPADAKQNAPRMTPVNSLLKWKRKGSVKKDRAHVISAFEQSLNNMAKRLQAITYNTMKKDAQLQQMRATFGNLRSEPGSNGTLNKEWSGLELGENVIPHSDCMSSAEGVGKMDSNGTTKKSNWLKNSITKAFKKKLSAPIQDAIQQAMPDYRTETLPSPNHIELQAYYNVSEIGKANTLEGFEYTASNDKVYIPESINNAEKRSSTTFVEHTDRQLKRPNALSVCYNEPSNMNFNHVNGWIVGAAQQPTVTSRPQLDSATSEQNKLINPNAVHNSSVYTPRMIVLQSELFRLRAQLSERELKLTDVQLEALASTHQLNQLRDQIIRMNAELEQLRLDNERLHQIMDEPAAGSLPYLGAQDVPSEDEWNFISGPGLDYIFGKCTPDTDAILIPLRFDQHSIRSSYRNSMGFIRLDTSATPDSIELEVKRVYENYIKKLDGKNTLGVDGDDHLTYQLRDENDTVLISTSQPTCDLTKIKKSAKLENNFKEWEVSIRTNQTENYGVDQDIAVNRLAPSPLVSNCIRLLKHYGCVIVNSSNLCSTSLLSIIQSIIDQFERNGNITHQQRFTDDGSGGTEQLESCVRSMLSTDSETSLLVIERPIETRYEVVQVLVRSGYKQNPHPRLYILWMCQFTPMCEENTEKELCRFISFDDLPADWNRTYLTMMLRKRLIDLTVETVLTTTACTEEQIQFAQKLVEWLGSTWERLNLWYIEMHQSETVKHEASILDVSIFDDLPLDETESWFVNCWNTRIAPKFQHAKQSLADGRTYDELMNWLRSSWPWETSQSNVALRLQGSHATQ